ncbi:MAG TPA: flagellar assembly protein FliW [Gaiellaceae bacterium]|jgi:flagellar assembly factor FliW
MQIDSTRFGTIEVRDDAILDFPDGLPGLRGVRWAFVAASDDSPFFWLHSVEHADVAVPVTSPWLFVSDYEVRVNEEEARRLALSDPSDAYIVCVVKATENIADFTINLAGPLIINAGARVGRQVLNDAGGYSVRHPLFSEVELNEVQPSRSAVPVTAAAG